MYKQKKVYTIYEEGAIFCCFLCQRSVSVWGNSIFFSKTEIAGTLDRRLSVIFDRHITRLLLLSWQHPLAIVQHSAQDKLGPEFHPLQFTANKFNTDICKLYATKWQTYHYFEIVYVKVIFLHVDWLLFCVLEYVVSVLFCFFVFVKKKEKKIEKVNSVC